MPPLYTRTGDDGTTGLYRGQRALKTHPVIVAGGEVDELNAQLGLALVVARSLLPATERILTILTSIQSTLFDLGADLSALSGGKENEPDNPTSRIKTSHIPEIESWIDEIDQQNEPLKTFILPGGSEFSSLLHLARAVCRRAERALLAALAPNQPDSRLLIYLNRLSDLLFALARQANAMERIPDLPWPPPSPTPAPPPR